MITEFERVAPRLAKAHREEKAYRERRRAEMRRGLVSLGTATEEMARSMRLVGTSAADAMQKLRTAFEGFYDDTRRTHHGD
jgi:hypothetical protein